MNVTEVLKVKKKIDERYNRILDLMENEVLSEEMDENELFNVRIA